MFGLGINELLIIFAILLLLFGANRIPKLASSLGKAIKEFRKSGSEESQKQKSTPKAKEKVQNKAS